ncbi:MAG TPA: efflux RND transporter permease subunit [Gemmatales bacterium]|nr:efflux RND transporter permease subunit [Gemmatales bacterium]
MVRQLIAWSLANPLIVCLLAITLFVLGGYAFTAVNIEAYPDPAPAIIEVVAQYPGASAEEIERLVTIPLEVALAGMPGLESCRSKSLFGLAHLRNQFSYARDYEQAKQDVINRLAMATLPNGVSPQISPASPIGEILRYTLKNPRDAHGQPLYTINDLKALQDYTIQRELLRVPRIAGVTAAGGMTKRYEVQPDPVRLNRYGISLSQLQTALGNANTNGSGDNVTQGAMNIVVRTLGLFGQGQDPQQQVLGMKDPVTAARYLRDEEARRCIEIRQTVVASNNNVPIRVDQLVDGGPLLNSEGQPNVDNRELVKRGVVVSNQTRQGRVSITKPRLDANEKPVLNEQGKPIWDDEDDVVQGIVLLRKGQESLPALRDLLKKVEELNQPGRLLPGVEIVPFYNRTDLINRTTETVHENLLVGMALVSVILLMFLGNVRATIIVALNIPLALLFAFGVLYARNKSANLLSIGAVDFGIIVDSTVIIVESIFTALTADSLNHLTIEDKIKQACGRVERSLFFATVVMVCALLPLFTMKGPEGQIFGPMADTYAFSLAGALLLALTVSPVLCFLLLRRLKPRKENLLVRALQAFFVLQLRLLLTVRWITLALFLGLLSMTAAVLYDTGREFMPELEEGNMMIRGTFPVNVSLDEVTRYAREFRAGLQQFGELAVIVPAIGRPDDGTDPTGYYNMETFIPLLPDDKWPVIEKLGRKHTKAELVDDINQYLDERFPGVDWDISQIIRDNVMEALSGVKGENSIKIFGPDLNTLEETAMKMKEVLQNIKGVDNPGVFRTQGQSNLELPVDRNKCARWNVSVADVQSTVQAAVGAKAVTQMQEGGKSFDISIRWPERLRKDETAILQITVPVSNQVSSNNQLTQNGTLVSSAATGLSTSGTNIPAPVITGSTLDSAQVSPLNPSRRLVDLVTPQPGQSAKPGDPLSYLRPGASTIYRESGQRLIAVKFGVRERDLASTVAEAKLKVEPMLKAPYRAEWSGEFQEMEEAEARLAKTFLVSLALIALLIYMAFRSFLDAAVVFGNVLAMGIGGVWALKLAGLNLNISAAVGFISILGVAVMNGLLLVSSFNRLRSQGVELNEALIQGTRSLIRPIVMTALAAILGLLPAAFSTKIGSQSQRPLAVVVVGGMTFTLIALNIVPVLYSFYGKRKPNASAGDMGH